MAPQHPIYFVIWERSFSGELSMRYSLPRVILNVIECDVTEIDGVWQELVTPLQNNGRQVGADFYTRESDSPFRQWAQRGESSDLDDIRELLERIEKRVF